MNAVLLFTWLGLVASVLVARVWSGSVLECPSTVPCNCSVTVDEMTLDFLLMVNCSSRGLSKFPELKFHDKSKVRLIDLRNNSLGAIPPNAFPNIKIEVLDFSYSENLTIHKDALQPIRDYLQKIILVEMGINFQEQLYFLHDMIQLREIVLDKNGGWLIPFPGAYFRGLRLLSLNKLSLKSCGIFRISWGAFVELDQLQELDLSKNFLTKIPSEISRLRKLRKLVLNSNQINTIPENTFQNLKDLRELYLVSNQLLSTTSIHKDSFGGLANSLRLIDFSNNDMPAVPIHGLKYMDSLETLILSDNRISYLANDSFNGTFRLKSLDISGNRIEIEEDMFTGLEDSLVTLYMKNTRLDHMPVKALKHLHKLTFIDVSYNNFQDIDGNFFRGLKARNIVMRSMRIRDITPQAFTPLKRPIVLDIAGNKVNDVTFVVQAPQCTFYELNLSENPIDCSCKVERIINSGSVERLNGSCYTPVHYHGYKLNESFGLTLKKTCGSTERIFCDWQDESKASRGMMSRAILNCLLPLSVILAIITDS
ncbi:insulin-like growth factor-binding protein complex acid labile subunit [Octopus bimaculoides]|uniref:LRRCT domain-containing protein n=1 Tax=Octopus bimaculoides TaxID=37653 RepID=A0A0L8GA07_OCTBM|nr:insulin-like growth factor-binding protein complex acid labile subunit [Octopus bimaculoides]|eukprot:XP_014782834.1 PREDICTED: CD180 antigen-like [Octopus bimaculoides]